jgi:hypothetical protein
MQNNIGSYRFFTAHWPEPRNPTIIVTEGFIEFYVTATDQLLSRTWFLYGEVFLLNLKEFFTRLVFQTYDRALFALHYALELFRLPFISTKNMHLLADVGVAPFVLLEYIPTSMYYLFYMGEFTFEGLGLAFLMSARPWNFFKPFLTTGFLGFSVVSSPDHLHHHQPGYFSSQRLYGKTLLNETTLGARFQRTLNPIFRYDYKLGNYFTKTDVLQAPYLFTTISEITGGIRKAAWFFSRTFLDLLTENWEVFGTMTAGLGQGAGRKANPSVQPTFVTYNFYTILNEQSNVANVRKLALIALDQKFARMFLTTSMQQRIFANW